MLLPNSEHRGIGTIKLVKLVPANQPLKVVEPVSSLTNDELIEIYKAAQNKADNSLLNLSQSEGRKRQILYFLSEDEQLQLCKSIFGEECKWADETEKKEVMPEQQQLI